MRVWIVQREIDYEGSEVEGVFASPEAADAYRAEDHGRAPYRIGRLVTVEWDVEEAK